MKKRAVALILMASLFGGTGTVSVMATQPVVYVPEGGTIPEKNGEGDTTSGNYGELPDKYRHLLTNLEDKNILYRQQYISYEYTPAIEKTDLVNTEGLTGTLLYDFFEIMENDRRVDIYSEKSDYILSLDVIEEEGLAKYIHVRIPEGDPGYVSSKFTEFVASEASRDMFNQLTGFINAAKEDNLDVDGIMQKMTEESLADETKVLVTDIGPALLVVGRREGMISKWYIAKDVNNIMIDREDFAVEFEPYYTSADIVLKKGKGDPTHEAAPDTSGNIFPYISDEEYNTLMKKAQKLGSDQFWKLEPATDFNIDGKYFYSSELDGADQKNTEGQGKHFIRVEGTDVYNGKGEGAMYHLGTVENVRKGVLEVVQNDEKSYRLYIFKDHVMYVGDDKFAIYEFHH